MSRTRNLLLLLPILGFGPATPSAELDELLPALASPDAASVERAHDALERLVFAAGRPGAEAERRGLALELAKHLGGAEPVAVQLLLLGELERLGKGEVVPALAKLLAPGNDAALREGARRALEANPHVNAKRELRKALQGAEGALRIGIVNSLGVRRDILATGDLISLAEDPQIELRLAVLDALASIGEISAVTVLEAALETATDETRSRVQRAYLRLGDALVRNNERGAARRVYDRAMGFGLGEQAAALLGLAGAGLQSEVGRIAELLGAPDPVLRGAARDAAALMPGPAMTDAVLVELGKRSTPAARIELMSLLGHRGDERCAAMLRDLAISGDSLQERIAALEAIGSLRSADSLEVALPAALDALELPGDLAALAERTLASWPGDSVARELLRASSDGLPARRAASLRVLGRRREATALPVLLEAAHDPSGEVRLAALEALGSLGAPTALGTLLEAIERLGDAGGAATREAGAVLRALARIQGEDVVLQTLDRLQKASPAARAGLLRVLGLRGGGEAVAALSAHLSDAEPSARLAAIQGLARVGGRETLTLLRKIVEVGAGPERAAALQGLLRQAEALAAVEAPEAAALYRSVLGVVEADEDARVALRGLGETGNLEDLALLATFFDRKGVARDAGRAALRLAERMGDAPGARGVYERILELDVDPATLTQAVRRLRRLGVDVDLARRAGFVGRWWILAPLPNPDGSLWKNALGPESAVRLDQPVEVSGEIYRWKEHRVDDPRGLVVLEDLGFPLSNVGAYLYTEVKTSTAGPALLKLGSDDQVACWLDGHKVHAFEGNRSLQPDQDVVPVTLSAGTHRILLKVLNEGGGWGACLRITDPAGRPLPFDDGLAGP